MGLSKFESKNLYVCVIVCVTDIEINREREGGRGVGISTQLSTMGALLE